ncbi:reverse transcriptase [Plakobranchus ocellatus]|uniref:Reverse transcriptase n=1 Tax=Plakobranchus ocellatus TaxID=259542 RepID=A0AAV3YJD1_9GAST|nr:reverse transcriptase [Plakobranchus ocellatus]
MPRQANYRTCSQFLQSSSKPGQVHEATNRVLEELAIAICALVFTSEGGRKSWCGSAIGMDTQRKSLLDGCDDKEFSADLPEWKKTS